MFRYFITWRKRPLLTAFGLSVLIVNFIVIMQKVNPTKDNYTQIKLAGHEINQDFYVDKINKLRKGQLTGSGDVVTPRVKGQKRLTMNLGMVLVNLAESDNLIQHLRSEFSEKTRRALNIMLDYVGDTPIHFVIVTNEASCIWAGQLLANIVTERLAMGVIQEPGYRWRKRRSLPPLFFNLVDSGEIVELNPKFVQAMKQNIHPSMKQKDKYRSDFYYIAPLYHLAFRSLDRAVFIDASDLEFSSDISELYAEFDSFETSSAVMSVGLDLAPHYLDFLQPYIKKNPGTRVGKPGKLQGYNTGVVLYRFDRMRASHVYNGALTGDYVNHIVKKYEYSFALAEQDFLTNLGFEHPSLFATLPCQFNAQVSLQYLRAPFENIFKSYHYCDKKKNIKIFHLNGCGPSPLQCGHKLVPGDVYSNDTDLHFFHIDVQLLWRTLESVQTQDWSWRSKIRHKTGHGGAK